MTSAAAGFGGHPLVSALAAVDGILDGVSGTSLWSLSDDQVASLTAEAARVQARWAAVRLALVAEADSRGLAGRVGAASTQVWLRGVTRCAPGAAKAQVTLARSLWRGLDLTREA
ncbi:MAG: DUF222 domain-containing protein, partial [Micromonosporaceae bacterium]|nr:DUF222 domain-containing protein [Micromonosporaceae bacterium]